MDRGVGTRVFVSADRADRAFCVQLARTLHDAGVDVWLSFAGPEGDPREAVELRSRPIFLVVLSPAAYTSPSVRAACAAAYSLSDVEPGRVFVPIMAPEFGPYRATEAIGRVLRKLKLRRPVRVTTLSSPPRLATAPLVAQAQSLATQLFSPDALDQARQLFAHATQLDPEDVSAWSGLGEMCALLQCDAEALAAFEHALALRPANAGLWCDVAAMRSRLGDHLAALAAYERALEIDPDEPRALEQRGRMLLALHRPAEALATYEAVLARRPGEAHLWHAHGNALQALDRHAEALASFDRALTLWPHFTWVWRDKAASLRALGRHSEALAAERNAASRAS
jgi:Flp pilus assembly protein TadD